VNGRDPEGNCLGVTDGPCSDVADAVHNKFAKVKKNVNQSTAAGFGGIVANAGVGFVLDATEQFLIDPLRAGQATGQAVGEGKGAVETGLAVVQDVGRAAQLAAGLGTVVKTGSRMITASANAVRAARVAGAVGEEAALVSEAEAFAAARAA
jgi:hypothetical protein